MKKYFCDKCDGHDQSSTYLKLVTLSSQSLEDSQPGPHVVKEFCERCLKRMIDYMNSTDPKEAKS